MNDRILPPAGARWALPDWNPEDETSNVPYLDEIHRLRTQVEALEARSPDVEVPEDAQELHTQLDEQRAAIERLTQERDQVKSELATLTQDRRRLFNEIDALANALNRYTRRPASFGVLQRLSGYTKTGVEAGQFVSMSVDKWEMVQLKIFDQLINKYYAAGGIALRNNSTKGRLVAIKYTASVLLVRENAPERSIVMTKTIRSRCSIPSQATGIIWWKINGIEPSLVKDHRLRVAAIPIKAYFARQ